jgi:hypothetical protein
MRQLNEARDEFAYGRSGEIERRRGRLSKALVKGTKET